jgi:nitrogen fixation protein FixH
MQTKFFQSPTMVVGLVLFLALVIGTIYRIMTAVNTHPGLVNENAYSVGDSYAQNLAIEKELKALGYSIDLKIDNYINYNKDHTYQAFFSKNKVIIDDAEITANFYRQLEPEFDFTAEFVNNTLIAKLPRKGKWLLVIKAQNNDKIMHKYHKIYAY